MVRRDRHRCCAEVGRKGLHGYDKGEGPPSLSYCSFFRLLEACGSSSRSDVLPHPQPGTKLRPDKSRKHQLLQKKASHNWVVAVLDGTPNVTSGPRRQHWPLQTISRVHSSLTEQLKVKQDQRSEGEI